MNKRTNIVINEEKLSKVKKLVGTKNTRQTIDYALSRILATSQAASELFKRKGKVDFFPQYNYKRYR
jgi:hypothetical protein